MPLGAVFLAIYAWSGLYPGVGLSPVEELRKLAVSTSGAFLLLATISALTQSATNYSRLFFAFSWTLALIFVQSGRWITRMIAVRLGAWGEPVVVVGYGAQGQKIVEFLLKNMRLGLKPCLAIDGFGESEPSTSIVSLIHLSDSSISTLPERYKSIRTAILVTSEIPERLQKAIINDGRLKFKRLITISPSEWIGGVGVTPREFEGFFGLEVHQNLFNPWDQALKRILDISLILISSLFILPVVGLIALLIRLDSRGPIFFLHDRVGKGDRKIRVWKFRTMFPNSDRNLKDYFKLHPESRVEWEATQKIKLDPRVTRIGRILRKTSMDELPQIWNVLKGEMSLVGPRPIINDQIQLYGQPYRQYTRVLPGITGMWQVSGRNKLSFNERVRLDEFYVHNWSIWLDIYILLRTVLVVLRRDGAY
jgi:Undecaprenyl-phosphate galactose phosphotransferase WbaP